MIANDSFHRRSEAFNLRGATGGSKLSVAHTTADWNLEQLLAMAAL